MSRRNMLPEGTRDLVLEECIIKKNIQHNIDKLFKQWGYKEVITSTLEFYETFNYYPESLKEEEMYKFFDNKGRILVLRPDMTIPIARLVSTKFKCEKLPIRLRYISNVFRVHESLGGKRNEYTDCGIELIGLEKENADIEILVLALEALKMLGLKDFKLEIGNIKFFNGVFKDLDIDEVNKKKIAKLIEDKNLKNLKDFLNELDIEDKLKEFFNKLPWMFGDKNILEESKKMAFNNELMSCIQYLEDIYIKLESLGYADNITFDLGMVPKLNYYTGIIFRGYGKGIGDSLLTGGRYDKLIKADGVDLQAVGFSIDIDSIISLTQDISYQNEKRCKVCYNNKNIIQAIKISEKLRNDGMIVELLCNENLEEIKIVKCGGI
ncbi:ATP phosphoribosyltransferase regulatory subunit [Clostridium sp. CTA-5]